MKKTLFLVLLCSLLLLCSCGENTGKIVAPEKTDNPSIGQGDNIQEQSTNTDIPTIKYDTIDVDLSVMSGTIAYSQVYDMLYNPSRYEGKIVKMQEPFSAFYSNETKLYYPAVIIKDATACCSQGIEFVLYGNPDYPFGYPEAGSTITIVGEFEIYYEGSDRFCHLINAVIV